MEYTYDSVIVRSTGIPNHDLESTIGCCASVQDYEWTLPRFPARNTDGALLAAPDRGAVAVTVAGVAIFGPEEGPGGDAVALHHGLFVEDASPLSSASAGGHSGPGGVHHYHFDANCMHWHPTGAAADMPWASYTQEQVDATEHAKVLGFAFDGYPIYGTHGWDD